MRNKTCRFVCILLVFLTISSVCGCSANQITEITATADRTEVLLDTGCDTLINYTITTPSDCVGIYIGQMSVSYMFLDDLFNRGGDYVLDCRKNDPDRYTPVVVNEIYFERKDVQVKKISGGLEWIIPVDFGFSGVYGASVRAVMKDGSELNTIADVSVSYPEYDIFSATGGIYEIWEDYILRNTTEPYVFLIDLTNSGYDYLNAETYQWHYFMSLGGAGSVFCYNSTDNEKLSFKEITGAELPNPWDAWLSANTPVYGETALVAPSGNNLSILVMTLTGLPFEQFVLPPNRDTLLCSIEREGRAPTYFEGEPSDYILPSCRAAVCYRGGVEPDEELFPKAAFLYRRGSEVLGSILTEGMSDYEKVKAIHDWMLTDGRNHSQNDEFAALSEDQQEDALKTSYGFMKGYGGDCMGWSDTFRMLCGMAGVRCSAVSCYAEGGGAVDEITFVNHSFNVAVLDGEVYYFDVYWDGAGSGYDNPPYKNFAMTGEQAGRNHTWLSSAKWGPPDAVSSRYATDPYTGEPVNK